METSRCVLQCPIAAKSLTIVQAMTLITRIYEHYPQTAYHTTVHQVVDDAILEQVAKKAMIASNSKTPFQKKELKDMGVLSRLQLLTTKAVLAVAERLSIRLRDIKIKERKAAETSVLKAAAQRRIIVPNADSRTVRSLVQWLYSQGALSYENPEHL